MIIISIRKHFSVVTDPFNFNYQTPEQFENLYDVA